MVQPGTYVETVSAAGACLYKHGRPLSGICSSFWLGAGPYGVGRLCYSLVRISRQPRQLSLAFINTGASCWVSTVVFGWRLVRAESGANGITDSYSLHHTDSYSHLEMVSAILSGLPRHLTDSYSFGTTPYELVFVWRYNLLTYICISR